MENQHRKITGYRELSESEIELMNAVKNLGVQAEAIVNLLRAEPSVDQRWASIGVTDIQKGLMALVRSVAKPTSF